VRARPGPAAAALRPRSRSPVRLIRGYHCHSWRSTIVPEDGRAHLIIYNDYDRLVSRRGMKTRVGQVSRVHVLYDIILYIIAKRSSRVWSGERARARAEIDGKRVVMYMRSDRF